MSISSNKHKTYLKMRWEGQEGKRIWKTDCDKVVCVTKLCERVVG